MKHKLLFVTKITHEATRITLFITLPLEVGGICLPRWETGMMVCMYYEK